MIYAEDPILKGSALILICLMCEFEYALYCMPIGSNILCSRPDGLWLLLVFNAISLSGTTLVSMVLAAVLIRPEGLCIDSDVQSLVHISRVSRVS